MIFDGRIDSELFFDGVAQTIKIHTGIACMQDLRWQWIEHFVLKRYLIVWKIYCLAWLKEPDNSIILVHWYMPTIKINYQSEKDRSKPCIYEQFQM